MRGSRATRAVVCIALASAASFTLSGRAWAENAFTPGSASSEALSYKITPLAGNPALGVGVGVGESLADYASGVAHGQTALVDVGAQTGGPACPSTSPSRLLPSRLQVDSRSVGAGQAASSIA